MSRSESSGGPGNNEYAARQTLIGKIYAEYDRTGTYACRSYIYIYIYIFMYIYVCIYAHVCILVAYIHNTIEHLYYIYIYICVCVNMCIIMYVYLYIVYMHNIFIII